MGPWCRRRGPFVLQDKVFIVTGASSGIGRALAEELAENGAKIVLAARRADRLSAVVQQLPGSNDRHLAVVTDVTNEQDCKLLVEKTLGKYGEVHGLINNAGISHVQPLREYDDCSSIATAAAAAATTENDLSKVFHNLMNTNFFGTLYCTKHAMEPIKRSEGDGGMIVAVSSMCGLIGVPSRSGYAASKHAVHGLLDSLRVELQAEGSYNVHILLACPGPVKTDIRMTASGGQEDPLNKSDDNSVMTAKQCAKMIIKAMEQKRRQVIVTPSFMSKVAPFAKLFFPKHLEKTLLKKQWEENELNLRVAG